ncbi:hypothetical protein [Streptococcus uberis]|uniref:hypothetical protein n=1 Tax=Streptococcus uberis TaxID=1349 RepID=UPI0027DBE107|nr:hypothetical protein [Streptococcus uberis]MCK1234983.1 hypothetical protein [Streptococcus uberis]
MIEVIQSIIAIGGFGFLNFQFISKINDVDFGSSKDKKYIIYFLSSFHYLIYLLIYYFLKNMVFSLLITILIISIFTYHSPFFIEIYYDLINNIRKKRNLESISTTSLYDVFATDFNKQNCFIFSLENNRFISSGYIGSTQGDRDDFSIILYPYIKENELEKSIIKSHEELINYLEENKKEANEYINFEKNVKFIYF